MKEYFSHDYNSRNDKKLIKVFMKYGVAGIGIYWCIIEMLYEEAGYLDTIEYERITFELRTEYDTVKDIIENFDLFIIKGTKFHSETAIDRLNKRADKSQKARESINKRWEKYERNTNVKETKNESNTSKVKDIKKKDIKERENNFKKECLKFHLLYTKEMIEDFVSYWTESNKSKSKMKFELQQTFDISRRLKKWDKNNFNNNSKKETEQPKVWEDNFDIN